MDERQSAGQGREADLADSSLNVNLLPAPCDLCRARKVKCDRQRPKCSHCRRTNASCSVLRPSRRVNHSKELYHDFSLVLESLAGFGQQIDVLTNYTKQVASQQTLLQQGSWQPSDGPSAISDLNESPSDYVDPRVWLHDFKRKSRPRNHGIEVERVSLASGGEFSYGHVSPLALARSLARQVNKEVQIGQKISASAMMQPRNQFPFSFVCPDAPPVDDGQPITHPPYSAVEMLLDGYLENVNAYTPIFEPSLLRGAAERFYRGQLGETETTWALILTNIVLVQLKLATLSQDREERFPAEVAQDLTRSLLRNCDRALCNHGLLASPTQLNVQALASLTLATREYYHDSVSDNVCQRACQMARTLGLHRQPRAPEKDYLGTISTLNVSLKQQQQQQQKGLFQALYILDKQRAWTTGQGFDLPLFEADVSVEVDEETLGGVNATFDLLAIWEETYLRLYTPKALATVPKTRVKQILLIQKQLENWRIEHLDPLRDAAEDDEALGLRLMELQYGHHTLKMLLCCSWTADGQPVSPEQAHPWTLEDARKSLEIIVQFPAVPTRESAAAMVRIFRNHTVIAFKEIVSYHLSVLLNSGAEDVDLRADFALLEGTMDRLGTCAEGSLPQAYDSRLQDGLKWMIRMLVSTRDVATTWIQDERGTKLPIDADMEIDARPSTDTEQCANNGRTSHETSIANPIRGETEDASGDKQWSLGLDILAEVGIPVIRNRIRDRERQRG